jgi:hypothetical protein
VSEITWYSRFAIWVGAIVLLVQAVAGRGAGFMSLVSIVLMLVGLAGFLFGLMWDEREPRLIREEAATVPNVEPDSEETRATEVEAAHRPPEEVAVLPQPPAQASTPPEHAQVPIEEDQAAAGQVSIEPEVQTTTAPAGHAASASNRVETEEIAIGSVLIGRSCIRCGNPLLLDQMAATCPVCRNPQHAGCWIENHFRCSTPGCSGRGSLEAPKSSDEE